MTELQQTGPGRPAIGGEIKVRLGVDLLATVDEWAGEHGLKRSEAVRELVRQALTPTIADVYPEADTEAAAWDMVDDETSATLGDLETVSDAAVDIRVTARFARGWWIVAAQIDGVWERVTITRYHMDAVIAFRRLITDLTATHHRPETGALWGADGFDGDHLASTAPGRISWAGLMPETAIDGRIEPPAPWEI